MLDFYFEELKRKASSVMGDTAELGRCKDPKDGYFIQDASRNISICGLPYNELSWYLNGFEDAQKGNKNNG